MLCACREIEKFPADGGDRGIPGKGFPTDATVRWHEVPGSASGQVALQTRGRPWPREREGPAAKRWEG